MLISLFRTVILFIVIAAALRLMGKRQIGELEPSELVATILISDLAAVPMQDLGIPLANGLIPIITIVLCELILSMILLKSVAMRRIVCGKPSIVITSGKIDQSELSRCRVTLDELLEELRLKNVTDIRTVKYGITETNGQLSVIKFAPSETPTRENLGLNVPDIGLTRTVINDGKISLDNLKLCGKDEKWLMKKLSEMGMGQAARIFYAGLNEQNELVVLLKKGENQA